MFLAWFGPRGLASVVFAILAVESLEGSQLLDEAVGVIAMTIALSVLLHGFTASLPGRHYAEQGHQDHDTDRTLRSRPTSFSRSAQS